jgi:hypothetical protein
MTIDDQVINLFDTPNRSLDQSPFARPIRSPQNSTSRRSWPVGITRAILRRRPRRRTPIKRAMVAGEIAMLRIRTSFGLVMVSLLSVFAIGCMAETNEPTGLIWYDEEFDACFETNKDGKNVEVPCDESAAMPGLGELVDETAGCTGSTCCEVKRQGFCP